MKALWLTASSCRLAASAMGMGPGDFTRELWQIVPFILDQLGKPGDVGNTGRRYKAELGQVTTQSVHRLGPLADHLLARPKQHRPRLHIGRLWLDEAHTRTHRRLDDRLRVGRIILLPLAEGLDVDRSDEPDLVAEGRHPTSPVVRRSTGFRGDPTRGKFRHEPFELRPRRGSVAQRPGEGFIS